MVVISSAVKADNPEVIEARKRKISVIPRAEMLGELMRGKTGIAVAGTHGKTTTTSMVASILTEARLDPTIVIGGKVGALGGNAKLGQSEFVVAEADESDGSFLHLPATFVAVTNIDNDHLDHFKNLSAIENAFVDFVGRIPFYGKAVVCLDDTGVQRVFSRFTKPVTTYGLTDGSDYRAVGLQTQGSGFKFELHFENRKQATIELKVPGRHNVLNALAAAALARKIGVSWDDIQSGLESFLGADRRFQTKWKQKDQWIVDDYGHHPTEIKATLGAARSLWKGRIICVFQPHRYSRTQNSFNEFLNSFTDADMVLVTDIYPAGEKPIEGISSETLVTAIAKQKKSGQVIEAVGDIASAQARVLREFKSGDLVMTMGAGSITKLSDALVEALK